MVAFQDRANAFLDIVDRPLPKALFAIWGLIATWDTFVSQFIPENVAKNFPKAYEVIAMTYGWLSIQTWFLIGAIIVVLVSLEYAARHRWRLEQATGSSSIRPTDDNTRLLLAGFWLCTGIVAVTILWFDANHWSLTMAPKIVVPIPPPSPVPPPVAPPLPKPTSPPPPKPPWVSPEEMTLQQNKGRPPLIYSPQEIFTMLSEGQNISVFGNRWVKVAGATSSLPIIEKIQNKDYYRIEFKLDSVRFNTGKVAAYFDPKKYGDILVNTRPGSQLKAICQFTKLDSRQMYPGNSYYSSLIELAFTYSNCELL